MLASLFETVGLITFFTAGDKEARASTLRQGESASMPRHDPHRHRARVHPLRGGHLARSRRGGIRAEAARRGLQRLEGKDYVVAEGDVLHVRFNV